jgi:hypothetical protein
MTNGFSLMPYSLYLRENPLELQDVGQIKRVARVVFGDDQQVARLGADLLDRRHRRLDGQRQHLGRQVVPAAGVEVGVHRRQLEAGVAHIDRAVKRRRVLHPLQAKPALDRRRGVQDALLEFVDRAVQGSDEMRNHAALFISIGSEF